MWMRERLRGELWGTLNLAVHGVGGVQMTLLGRMRWGYGRISEGVGESFQAILDLRWEMAPRLDSRMICAIACAKYTLVAAHLELSDGSNQL
jgi:hypothetical protein